MIRINLLPVRAAQKKERLVNQLAILSLAVIVVIVVCVLTWMSMSSRIGDVKAKINTQDTEINRLKKDLKQISGFEASKEALQAKLDILDKLKANRTGPVKLLDELSRATPEQVWILTFSESDGVISMTGGGMSEEAIAIFLKNLEESSSFMDVELEVLEQKKTDGHDHLGFKMRCAVETSTITDQPKKK
jgi:type IV pilus assembly protein PilN